MVPSNFIWQERLALRLDGGKHESWLAPARVVLALLGRISAYAGSHPATTRVAGRVSTPLLMLCGKDTTTSRPRGSSAALPRSRCATLLARSSAGGDDGHERGEGAQGASGRLRTN